MTDKPILDIEVNDSAFQRFAEQFKKHAEAVGKLPGAWGKVGAETKQATSSFDKHVAASVATAAATERMAKNQEHFMKATRDSSFGMEGLARHTGNIAKNIAGATASLMKWVGIGSAISGLLGVGSLWGLDRLALSEGSARRSALGLGLGSGQAQAFGLAYGRAVDANGFLSNVAGAQSDQRQAAAFYALGLRNYGSQDVAGLGQDVLDRIRTQAKATPLEQLGTVADARQWTQFLGIEDIRRLRNTPDDEYGRMRGNYGKYAGQLAINPQTQSAWQDFSAALALAGRTIENKLAGPLVKLAVPLEHVSEGFVKVASAFLESDNLKKWMGEIGDGLEVFAKFVGTNEFKTGVENFGSGVVRLARHIGEALSWLGITGDGQPATRGGGLYGPVQPSNMGVQPYGKWLADPAHDSIGKESILNHMGIFGSGGVQKFLYDSFRARGKSPAEAAGWLAVIGKESGFDKSKRGGLFQLTGDNLTRFTNMYHMDPGDASIETQLKFQQWLMESVEYKAARAIAGAADTPGEKYSVIRKAFERPSEDFRLRDEASGRANADMFAREFSYSKDPAEMPYRARDVNITIHNATGGSAVVSAAGAAQ